MAKSNILPIVLIGGLALYFLKKKPTLGSSPVPPTGTGFDSNLGLGLLLTASGHWYDPTTGWIYSDEYGTNPMFQLTSGDIKLSTGEIVKAPISKDSGWSLTDEERESQYIKPPADQTESSGKNQPNNTETIVKGEGGGSVKNKKDLDATIDKIKKRKRANVSAEINYEDEWSITDAPSFSQVRMRQVSKRPGENVGVAFTWTAGTTSWDGNPIAWDYKITTVFGYRDPNLSNRFTEVSRKSNDINNVIGLQPAQSFAFTTPGQATGTKFDIQVYIYGKKSTDQGTPTTPYTVIAQSSKTDAVEIIGSYGIPGSSIGTIEIAQVPNNQPWRYGFTKYKPRV